MVKKRGKCPSLISGTHGAPRLDTAKRKRTCKRCSVEIPQGTVCVVVPIPGSMGKRVYCRICTQALIDKSRQDIDKFERKLSSSPSNDQS